MHTIKAPVPCCTRLEPVDKYLGIFNMDNERHHFFTGSSIHCTTVFFFPIWWCSWGQSSISWCSQIWLLMTGKKLNTHYICIWLNIWTVIEFWRIFFSMFGKKISKISLSLQQFSIKITIVTKFEKIEKKGCHKCKRHLLFYFIFLPLPLNRCKSNSRRDGGLKLLAYVTQHPPMHHSFETCYIDQLWFNPEWDMILKHLHQHTTQYILDEDQ
jgi:hypothetical protein